MTPVDQQYLRGNPDNIPGDCVRACVASILDLPLADVPHFVQLADHDWADAMVDWCEARRIVATWKNGIARDPSPYMLTGPSPRAGRHAIVAQAGVMVHDPHPSRDGLRMEKISPHDPVYFISWIFRQS